jgi:aspartyl-tRNA(Asn)/glutamyl-tRNA(Gln) amidotransferase subunit A
MIANLALPAVDYIRSLRIRAMVQEAIKPLFDKYDLLAAPSMVQVAPQATADLDTYFVGGDGQISGMSNLLGLPAISVPIGFGHGNMPVGMQLIGRPLDEDTIFAVGAAYQRSTVWHESISPIYDTEV